MEFKVTVNDGQFCDTYLWRQDTHKKALIDVLCYKFYSIHFDQSSRRHLVGYWKEAGRIKEAKPNSSEIALIMHGQCKYAVVTASTTMIEKYFILNGG